MKYCILGLILLNFSSFATDISDIYRSQFKTISNSKPDLNGYKVLIIPGVLAESFLPQSNNALKFKVVFEEAFKDQINALKSIDADFKFVELETENSPEVNAKLIISEIQKSTKPVLIYSHSKGGLDTLEAISQNPNILNKIKGWATIQTPFYGSPIASRFNQDKILSYTSSILFKGMGGSKKGMTSMTIEERENYMENSRKKELIDHISNRITFINYASVKRDTLGYDTPLELFRNYCDTIAGENDGVVPVDSAILAKHNINIDYIVENDVDHLMTMTKFHVINQKFDRKAHTLTILNILKNNTNN